MRKFTSFANIKLKNMKCEFRFVPSEKAVYKIQENCCYTKVVYEEPGLGIYNRLDKRNEITGILLCHCDPQIKIEQFQKIFTKLITRW